MQIQLPTLDCHWTRVGEERESPPKDFARRTAIKPVAPCRGDFCVDIFSVSSFVPHRGSRLSLSFSLFRSRVLSLPVLLLPRHRYHSFSVSLSLSRRPSVNSSSFLPFHRAAHRHGQFRGHKVALHPSEESERGSACIAVVHENLENYSTDDFKFVTAPPTVPRDFEKSASFQRRFQSSVRKRRAPIRAFASSPFSIPWLFPVSRIETDIDMDK